MKLRFLAILILPVWLAGIALKGTAQPNWELNPQDYEFSMNITGKVNTDGNLSVDENDMVAAFSNGICRGFAKLTYEKFENDYFAYLMVYSNSPLEVLTFKIFDYSKNEIVATNDTINFVINNIIGSMDSPFIFSSGKLGQEARITYFNIPLQIGEALIEGNSIYLKSSSNSKLTNTAAGFSVTKGATVFVDGIEQQAFLTINDFSSPVKYMIVSANLSDTAFYTVYVTLAENNAPEAINLSNIFISESAELNAIVATIKVEDLDPYDSHTLRLVAGNGVNDAQNSLFKIVDDNLVLVQPINFEDNQFLRIFIRATDKAGDLVEESLVLQVTNENDPPKFNTTPLAYIFQGEVFVYSLSVTDSNDDPVEITFENLPDWISYSSNSKLFTGIAKNEDVGDYNFKIRASDGKIESVQIVAFTVINVNEPPEINKYIDNQLFLSNRDNEIQLPADCIIDPDIDDKLIFKLSTRDNSALPAWLNFNRETLTLSGYPPQGIQAVYDLQLTATDKGNLKEFLIFSLEVTIPTAISEQSKNTSFKVYPNPVQNNLYFDIPDGSENATISVINMAGQIVKTWQKTPGLANMVAVNDVEPGIYFVRLRQGKSEQIKKIIKE